MGYEKHSVHVTTDETVELNVVRAQHNTYADGYTVQAQHGPDGHVILSSLNSWKSVEEARFSALRILALCDWLTQQDEAQGQGQADEWDGLEEVDRRENPDDDMPGHGYWEAGDY